MRISPLMIRFRRKLEPIASVPVIAILPLVPGDDGENVALSSVTLPLSAGDVPSTAEPLPVTAYSPSTPALLYSTRPVVPPVIAVVPTSRSTPSAVGFVQDVTPEPLVVRI